MSASLRFVVPALALLPLVGCAQRDVVAAPTASQTTASTARPDVGMGHDAAPVAPRENGDRPETDPLRFSYYGLPRTDPSAPPLTILFNHGYVVGYDDAHHRTVWVAYRLSRVATPPARHRYGPANPPMPAGIVADARVTAPTLPPVPAGAKDHAWSPWTYAPAGGIAASYGPVAGDETRLGTDVLPFDLQPGDPWLAVAGAEDSYARTYGELWVMTGPVGEGGAAWKIEVTIQHGRTAVQAFLFPHQGAVDPATCLTTAAVISARTGLEFFSDFHDLDHDRREIFAHQRRRGVWAGGAPAVAAPVANRNEAPVEAPKPAPGDRG
jgi:hypothetical protein